MTLPGWRRGVFAILLGRNWASYTHSAPPHRLSGPSPGRKAMPDSETPATPTPTPTGSPKRSLFSGTMDSVRNWLKVDDDSQAGLREDSNIRRAKHKQVRLLFLDVGNSSRSQVAQAFAQIYGFHAESAGTFPSVRVQDDAVHAMKEVGIDISGFRPKPLDANRLDSFDRIITFGDVMPKQWKQQKNVEFWNVMDPQGLPLDAYRTMRKDTEKRIKRMAKQFNVKQPEFVTL